MKSCVSLRLLISIIIVSLTNGQQQKPVENQIDSKQRAQGRQSLGTNLVDPYYMFNPDYMGGNMPNVPLYELQVGPTRTGSCTCSCGYMSFGPPITCLHPQHCIAYCLQMYGPQCTLINTYGCCGSSCQYFQSQSVDNQHCLCSCAGQQYFNPVDTCTSSQACLTRCISTFSQNCVPAATEACCGSDCTSYSQAIATSCACRCRGNTYYPSPQCLSGEACVATCMTTYGDCIVGETQGCCGPACATYIPTCSCRCGSDFQTITSVPCLGGQSCIDTCISSYGACTQDNTQACCGNDCRISFPLCTCMCGNGMPVTLPISCGSGQQCVQACLQSVAQCTIMNTFACCGGDCQGFIPTCRCQCGSNIYYPESTCMTPEQCTNTCISRYGNVCTPGNTIGCCNGTICTRRNRFVGVSKMSTISFSYTLIVFSMNSLLYFV